MKLSIQWLILMIFLKKRKTVNQPSALYLLFFARLWECFSYSGMRVLLVLFMTSSLHYNDYKTFGVYAVYTSLTEAGGIIGGYLADKILGFRKTLFLGALVLTCGHICMAIPLGILSFYLGLGFIIVGSSLFRTNCSALLSLFYKENDSRRDAGFTLFYVGINTGAFSACLLCGYIGECFGWHYGFGLAAFGMLLGFLALYQFQHFLEDKGMVPKSTTHFQIKITYALTFLSACIISTLVFFQEIFINILPLFLLGSFLYIIKQTLECKKQEKRDIAILGGFIFLLAIFFAFEEQLGSTLILFSERHVQRRIGEVIIPASILTTLNPLTIIIIGPFLSICLQYFEQKRKTYFSIFGKIIIAFGLLTTSYALISLGCIYADNNTVRLSYIVGALLIMATGELFIGPSLYTACGILAPKKMIGIMMSAVMLGYSCANILSGKLSQFMAVSKQDGETIVLLSSLNIYKSGFYYITLISFAITITLFFLAKLKKFLRPKIMK